MVLEEKINLVKDILRDKKVVIGFSGGADSTLLAYLSSLVSKETLAITIDNHLFPTGFINNAKKTTEKFKIQHEIIDINFYENEDFLLNNPKRCYNCRNLMYKKIKELANKRGYDLICDGNNISDLIIDRPGILITYANQFTTPFIEARLSSKEIHEYLNKNNIKYYKSTTCLATRIPTNTAVSKEKIERISYCEDYILNNTDCEIVKVRDLGKDALCEVDNINEIINDDKYQLINNELINNGFNKVSLNLSQIDDDGYIKLEFKDNSFRYQLPYAINLKDTLKQYDANIIKKSDEKLEINNIVINEDGLITGHNLETYDEALTVFMDTLSKIRRKV